MLLYWDWENLNLIAKTTLGIQQPPSSLQSKSEEMEPTHSNFVVSFNPSEKDHIVITGPEVYKYYKMQ